MPDQLTPDKARRTFALLMTTAQKRPLTPAEKTRLTYARQWLRGQRKATRRNPGSKKVSGPYSVYVFKAGRGMVFAGSRTSLTAAKKIAQQEGGHGYEIYGKGGAQVARAAVRAPSTPLARRNPARGGMVRMGKLVELRYNRDHGSAKGFYKHTFKVRPEIFYNPADNSILIKGGRS